MTTHVARAGETGPACGRDVQGLDPLGPPLEPVVTWEEATALGGRAFDCVACHRELTGGQRHTADGSER